MILDYNLSLVISNGIERSWFNEAQLEILTQSPAPICDRTGTVDVGLPMTVVDAIPTEPTSKSFEQICNERAEQIKALGKPVQVLWSGGIDSTLALVSLIKAKVDDLEVRLDSSSIMEYPKFYSEHIAGKIKTVRALPAIMTEEFKSSDKIYVTGELGDQLFGSQLMLQYEEGELLAPWQDVLAKSGKSRGWIDLFQEQTKKAPFEIKTAFDFYWWLNFSCKWQNVVFRLSRGYAPSLFQQRVQHFFRSDDFQRWSINESNHANFKWVGDFRNYKRHAKEAIFDFTKDKNYLENKLKVGSLRIKDNRLFKFADDRVFKNEADCSQFDHLFEANIK